LPNAQIRFTPGIFAHVAAFDAEGATKTPCADCVQTVNVTEMPVGVVQELRRYPVKSMAAESLQSGKRVWRELLKIVAGRSSDLQWSVAAFDGLRFARSLIAHESAMRTAECEFTKALRAPPAA
jgi:hypothetical protein